MKEQLLPPQWSHYNEGSNCKKSPQSLSLFLLHLWCRCWRISNYHSFTVQKRLWHEYYILEQIIVTTEIILLLSIIHISSNIVSLKTFVDYKIIIVIELLNLNISSTILLYCRYTRLTSLLFSSKFNREKHNTKSKLLKVLKLTFNHFLIGVLVIILLDSSKNKVHITRLETA